MNAFIGLPGVYHLPLRIDMQLVLDAPGFVVCIGDGHVTFATAWSDNRHLGDLLQPDRKPKMFHNHLFTDTPSRSPHHALWYSGYMPDIQISNKMIWEGLNVLDLSNFKKAISAMERTLAYGKALMHKDGAGSEIEKEVLTAAVVQHFEFTYELCWKFMRRWLETNLSPGVTAGLSRKQLFRLAAEQLLIDAIDDWFAFHELRNLTAHTYNSETAAEIMNAAPDFCKRARGLLSALESRND